MTLDMSLWNSFMQTSLYVYDSLISQAFLFPQLSIFSHWSNTYEDVTKINFSFSASSLKPHQSNLSVKATWSMYCCVLHAWTATGLDCTPPAHSDSGRKGCSAWPKGYPWTSAFRSYPSVTDFTFDHSLM